MNAKQKEYFYSLDLLRVFMMFLGILLHGSISYTTLKHGANWPLFIGKASEITTWPYQDENHHVLFDYVHNIIHIFRMPLFFVLSGFLAHHALRKKGMEVFIQSRKKRILFPLLFFWPILFPLVGFGLLPLMTSQKPLTFWYILSVVSPMHLWFLVYLLYFYTFMIGIELALRKCPAISERVYDFKTCYLSSPLSIIILSLLTFVILVLSNGEVIAAASFLPNLPALLIYFSFFFYGWLLYLKEKHVLKSTFISIILVLFGIILIVVMTFQKIHGGGIDSNLTSLLSSVSVWCIVIGFFNAFNSMTINPSPLLTYIKDSSYWIYLIHFPIVIWLVQFMSNYDFSVFFKVGIVTSITTITVMFSYELGVRKTQLGKFLIGRNN